MKLVEEKGSVHLAVKQVDNGDRVAYDCNRTWEKISEELPHYIQNICGENLKESVYKFVSARYMTSVKKATAKAGHLNVVIGQNDLEAIKTGELKLKIQKRKK